MISNNATTQARLEFLPDGIRVGDLNGIIGYSCLTGEAHDVWVSAESLASALAQEDGRGDLRFGLRPLPLMSLGDQGYHVMEHVLSTLSERSAYTMWAFPQREGPRSATEEEVEAFKKKTEIKSKTQLKDLG